MKKKRLFTLAIIAICGLNSMYLFWLIEAKEQKINAAETEVFRLWDEKIADHQFRVNVTYRDSESKKSFFDSLIISFGKLRLISNQKNLSESDKKYLRSFIFNRMTKMGFIKEAEILERLEIKSEAQIFEGSKLELIQRLERVLNPYVMTKCMYMQDFDIWHQTNNRKLRPGDTTVFMIRILKNYDLGSHQLELIPSSDTDVVEPYLGAIKTVIPKNEKRGISLKFQMYNWLKRDTITQDICLSRNWAL